MWAVPQMLEALHVKRQTQTHIPIVDQLPAVPVMSSVLPPGGCRQHERHLPHPVQNRAKGVPHQRGRSSGTLPLFMSIHQYLKMLRSWGMSVMITPPLSDCASSGALPAHAWRPRDHDVCEGEPDARGHLRHHHRPVLQCERVLPDVAERCACVWLDGYAV